MNSTKRIGVIFELPDDVEDLTLRAMVGWGQDGDPSEELAQADIRLPGLRKDPRQRRKRGPDELGWSRL